MPFDQIQDSVLSGIADAGVIIHENRFTYQEKGLNKIADLGDEWEKITKLPIPLGGIVARRSLHKKILLTIDRIIFRSLEHSFRKSEILSAFVTSNAQELSESVMRSHISLYVNDYSLGLGELGKAAVRKLFEVSRQIHSFTHIPPEEIFLDHGLEQPV